MSQPAANPASVVKLDVKATKEDAGLGGWHAGTEPVHGYRAGLRVHADALVQLPLPLTSGKRHRVDHLAGTASTGSNAPVGWTVIAVNSGGNLWVDKNEVLNRFWLRHFLMTVAGFDELIVNLSWRA